jgi:hypothetical protein
MTYSKDRQRLIDRGYIPLPIAVGRKGPAKDCKGWTADDYTPPTSGRYNQCGTGILCGRGENPVAGIDCDIYDEDIAQKMTDYILETCGETVYRIGKFPKVMIVYQAEKAGIRKRSSKHYDCGHVEFWGYGEQFVAFGTHPDTQKPYYWPGILGDILDVPAAELPVLPEAKMQDIINHFQQLAEAAGYKIKAHEEKVREPATDYDPENPLDKKEPIGVKAERCKAILTTIDADCGRDQWRNIGMSLHHEFRGSGEGFRLWDEWSAGGSKYIATEMSVQWDSFGRYTGKPLTGAYLLKFEKKQKKEDPWKSNATFSESEIFIPGWENQPPEENPLVSLNGIPILTRGNISMITAYAGSGKSSLMEAVCASAVYQMADTLGLSTVENIKICFIDTERSTSDSHNAWRRFMRRCEIEVGGQIPGNVTWLNIRGMDTIEKRMTHLRTIINGSYDLIIIDGVGDYCKDVNNPDECIPLINELCAAVHNHQFGILLTLHTNPGGPMAVKARGVLGSELWRKSQFVGIIEKVDEGVRKLTTEYALGKNRSGSDQLSSFFKWDDITKMHVTCHNPAQSTKRPGRTEMRMATVLEKMELNAFTSTDLTIMIMEECEVKERQATNIIKALIENGRIIKNDTGYYQQTTDDISKTTTKEEESP